MSNIPSNPYNNAPGAPHMNSNPGAPVLNHSQYGQVSSNQIPPSYGGLKQDANSNSPQHLPANSAAISQVQSVNNYHQSASSSPAFNQPGMISPPSQGLQSSPMRSHPKPPGPTLNQFPNTLPNENIPFTSASPRTITNINPSPNLPYLPHQQHINHNAPPLAPSSQYNRPLYNDPPTTGPPGSVSHNSVSSNVITTPPTRPPASTNFGPSSMNSAYGPQGLTSGLPISRPPGPSTISNQSNVPFCGPPSAIQRNSPMLPPVSGSAFGGPSVSASGPSRPSTQSINGPPTNIGVKSMFPAVSGTALAPHKGPLGPPGAHSGVPSNPPTSNPPTQNQSYTGLYNNVPSGPMSLPGTLTSQAGPPAFPVSMGMPSSYGPTQGLQSGPSLPPMGQQLSAPPLSGPGGQMGPPAPHAGPIGLPSGPPGPHTGPLGPPSGPPGPPIRPGPLSGPSGPPKSNMQNRYPQMPPGGYVNHQTAQMQSQLPAPPMQGQPPIQQMQSQPPMPQMQGQPPMPQMQGQPPMPQMQGQPPMPQMPGQPGVGRQYPQQYGAPGLTQQMGQLSVTKQGFDQLWGHHMVDLLQCRHILPEYPEDPPEIKLGHQFADAPNCSSEIFRSTINRIPESNSLLQKSRLPLGILIHPFKDLNHLPVIQCTTIVRCRACRTYINPFVYFVDSKRWKCNLCYRVNDLPEEFQYDPVSKSYGDPTRRPEIKSATIEFIAPGEYMLRPPQPAVYLFLMDVSQIARESGYLQVFCETLKNCLDQLPGDARTQVGFICYDAHVHYYLMSELTRPKEMTVLDIDDMFLPSPESLLVNLGERREMVKELLTVLPQRHCTPGVPSSALGAALQAAYKLMAPTGGRITVFQTCLPNIGPGALQPREDPNARSSKEVSHLNPATDFYKRLALDCSGAQIAVDLFLLTSQYCDLATLSGMSKFSAGTVYHIPLFKASRTWQAEQFRRMLTRYLTRKIGFEAVMRVRCTRGISIHTFHGNFFVRSTDLLSLPNVSPDAGFGMQLSIEESLSDLQQVCFQAALLYTSSKGERRIRVHTLALPIANTLTDVLHSADQQCIIGLLCKMAVDRCASASMSEAREALMNVAVDALSAHRLAQNLPAGALSSALHAPASLKLLPLYLLATLKRRAFRTGTSTRLDDRVADMCDMKTMPLPQLIRAVYPDLYPIHTLREHTLRTDDDEEFLPDPPRLHLSAERVNMDGAYLLDDGETMVIYICSGVSAAFLSETFGVCAVQQLADEARAAPRLHTRGNQLLHAFIDKLNDERPYAANVLVLRDTSPSKTLFTERLVDDRVESAFSYYEFLQHVKSQVK